MPGVGDHTKSSYGHDGWDPPADYGKYRDGEDGGGGGGSNRDAIYRFKVPPPKKNPIKVGEAARKRVLIIGVPFYLWEHDTYGMPRVPRGVFQAICLRENRIADICPPCQAKFGASYAAYFTVIELGYVVYQDGTPMLYPEPWVDRKGEQRESQFQKRLMVAKRGGKDNPGKLAYFEDQRSRRGDLTGCVYDTLRGGGKEPAIGNTWEFVERAGSGTIPEMREYLLRLGADPKYVEREDLFQRYTIRDLEKTCLFDADEMARWVDVGAMAQDSGRSGRQVSGSGAPDVGRPAGGRVEGAGYSDDGAPPDDKDFRGGPGTW
ncbi:MAG: hypothetical protein WC683_01165 [bacterium]